MTFLDAYALVALLADEPAADEVETILRDGDSRVVIVNLAEAVDISQRVHHVAKEEVRAALEPLILSDILLPVVSGEPQAWLAADIRSQHYKKRTLPLSMADCFLIAHAVTDDRPIATPDPSVAEVARAAGVELTPLPDSSGSRP